MLGMCMIMKKFSNNHVLRGVEEEVMGTEILHPHVARLEVCVYSVLRQVTPESSTIKSQILCNFVLTVAKYILKLSEIKHVMETNRLVAYELFSTITRLEWF